jgi:hypothetical protein
MLSADSRRPQDLASRALAADGGFGFDLGDQIGDEDSQTDEDSQSRRPTYS